VPEDSDIQSAKELEGKTVAALSLQATSAIGLTKASVAAAGGDPDKVTFVAIDQGAPAIEALKSGRVQALAMYSGAYANMKSQGMPMRSLQAPELSKLGFSFAIIAKPETITSKHDALVKFLRGIAETFEFAKANPTAAAQQWLKDNPTMKPAAMSDEEATQAGVDVITGALNDATPYTTGQWGSEGDDVVQYTADTYKDAGVVQGSASADKLWTDELIADVNDFDHAAVQKKAADY
jgi:NitT/TauT family transport system substrate-binding protein